MRALRESVVGFFGVCCECAVMVFMQYRPLDQGCANLLPYRPSRVLWQHQALCVCTCVDYLFVQMRGHHELFGESRSPSKTEP